jgi:hypothetical protein
VIPEGQNPSGIFSMKGIFMWQDDTRINDKIKNAFGIDIIATAQRVLEERVNVKLVPVAQESAGITYEEKREGSLRPFIPMFLLIGLIAMLLGRR